MTLKISVNITTMVFILFIIKDQSVITTAFQHNCMLQFPICWYELIC